MEWAVPSRVWILEALAALPFVAVTVLIHDPLTRSVAGAAALLLLALALRDRVAQVRLSADHAGVTLVDGLSRRKRIPWSDIVSVRVDERSRRGRSARLLEIDTGVTVHLLSGRELGADPADVAAALDELRP